MWRESERSGIGRWNEGVLRSLEIHFPFLIRQFSFVICWRLERVGIRTQKSEVKAEDQRPVVLNEK